MPTAFDCFSILLPPALGERTAEIYRLFEKLPVEDWDSVYESACVKTCIELEILKDEFHALLDDPEIGDALLNELAAQCNVAAQIRLFCYAEESLKTGRADEFIGHLKSSIIQPPDPKEVRFLIDDAVLNTLGTDEIYPDQLGTTSQARFHDNIAAPLYARQQERIYRALSESNNFDASERILAGIPYPKDQNLTAGMKL